VFGIFPTPIEPLGRLGPEIGLPYLYVKRDDQTGFALGGNKVRKLEYLMSEALAQGADLIVATGAVQSNSIRQTAAAASRLGLDCVALLEPRVPNQGAEYRGTGNRLLGALFGAETIELAPGRDPTRAAEDLVEERRRAGRRPYLVPAGGSNAVGSLGSVDCAAEICAYEAAEDAAFDRIIVASASAGTQAGLIAGLAVEGRDLPVVGISVARPRDRQEAAVHELACAAADLLNQSHPPRSSAIVDDRFLGDGYGLPCEATWEAIVLAARLEGLVLDPVYTGKALCGLIHLARRGEISPAERVLFLHTGGSPALFAYGEDLGAHLKSHVNGKRK
jgi:L-cysteate sulfo-lyase